MLIPVLKCYICEGGSESIPETFYKITPSYNFSLKTFAKLFSILLYKEDKPIDLKMKGEISMTITTNTTMDHIHVASTQTHEHRIHNSVIKVWRFFLHLLEMLLAMMVGMPILFMLRNLIPASSSYAEAFGRGTILLDLAMAIFMTVPMVLWMVVRGHGWRHAAEMAFGMNAPVVAIIVLRLLGADVYLPWLVWVSHPVMPLGMIFVMLYRRDHYTGKAGHSAHVTHREANEMRSPANS